jgi:hypothetical protein
MFEHDLVTGGDFAPARKILSKALPHLFGHFSCSPLDLLLHRAQPVDLALPSLDCFLAIPIGFTLIGSEKGELDGGYCLFQPVEPVVIHLGNDHEQEASQRDHGESSNTRTGERA